MGEERGHRPDGRTGNRGGYSREKLTTSVEGGEYRPWQFRYQQTLPEKKERKRKKKKKKVSLTKLKKGKQAHPSWGTNSARNEKKKPSWRKGKKPAPGRNYLSCRRFEGGRNQSPLNCHGKKKHVGGNPVVHRDGVS